MKLLKYEIWNKKLQCVVNCDINDVFIRYDGKIGFIDTVGRFIEDDDLCINKIEII